MKRECTCLRMKEDTNKEKVLRGENTSEIYGWTKLNIVSLLSEYEYSNTIERMDTVNQTV